VTIHRLRSTRWSHLGTLAKAVDFASFYLGALWGTLRLGRARTIVVAMTDPPLLGVGVWLAARCRGATVIHWIQDIYPEIALLLLGQNWLRWLRPLRNLAWRRADACVTIGTDMAAAFAPAAVRASASAVIPNWAPEGVVARARSEPNRVREAWGLADRFVVAYSGNLGRVHDLEPVITLAHALRAQREIVFVIVGEGAQRPALEAAARKLALPNLQFRPAQPRSHLSESLAAGDLHLVTLRPGCERAVYPSKLYGIAAAGRPVLFIGPTACEVARCVRENSLGHAADRDDIAGMAAWIRHLAADPAAFATYAHASLRFAAGHSAPVAIDRWHQLLLSRAGPPC
jgi:glycosyltransferase involved in cell wall biosynthesis